MSVSIIIPTWNRKDALLETLAALAVSNYPASQWEAVVIDDGSTDDTETAIREWLSNSSAPVRYVKQQNAGPAAARNHGARIAQGQWLLFIDNDILVQPDFIRRHVETLTSHPGCWVVGRITHPPALRRTVFGRYRDALWELFHDSHTKAEITPTAGISAANLALPTADFRRLGGFDEDFTIASSEDWDLGVRARQAGIRILYNPSIVALHNDWAITLEQFCRRQMLYSISDVLLWQKYGDASLRARLVLENAPMNWGQDSVKLLTKKLCKQMFATKAGRAMVRKVCSLTETLAADSYWNHRAYELAVAIAVFQGVREGWQRYILRAKDHNYAAELRRAA